MSTKVDVAIACSSFQSSNWWVPLINSIRYEMGQGIEIATVSAISSALPDHNKNHNLSNNPYFSSSEEKGRNSLTDANRVEAVKRFLERDSEWVFFIDDDTTHPIGTLSKLLSLAKDFVGGVYFNAKEPFNPIAYLRRPDGLYHALYGYAPGTLMQVDSIGMGCTLIHRSVFERIQKGHTVFQRPNGSLYPVPNSRILGTSSIEEPTKEAYVKDNVLHMPLAKVENPADDRPWPFFALEYGRTEDHHFCELAENVGIKPWIDTTITCAHWKTLAVGEEAYEAELYSERQSVMEKGEADGKDS